MIELDRSRRVSGLKLLLGDYLNDFPREISVRLKSDGRWREHETRSITALPLASQLEPNSLGLRLEWPTQEIEAVELVNLATVDPWYWSVAELEVFEPIDPE